MEIKTKILFICYGPVFWLDKNDNRHFFDIDKKKALFRWAYSKDRAEFHFKRAIFRALKRFPNHPVKFSDVLLYDTNIEEIKKKKGVVQKQLKLFKRMPQ